MSCRGCGIPIEQPGRGARRIWCSERCRKAQYQGACEACGAPTHGGDGRSGPKVSTLCFSCNQIATRELMRMRNAEKREMVERLWREGALSGEIAVLMGWSNPRQAATYISNLRARGYNLPRRRSQAFVISQRERTGGRRFGRAAA